LNALSQNNQRQITTSLYNQHCNLLLDSLLVNPQILQNMYKQEFKPVRYLSVADPSWDINRKIAWLKRREWLRNHPEEKIPEWRSGDREYHRWWHTKGKHQSMRHYVDGEQVIG
jgi:hypothetical protein